MLASHPAVCSILVGFRSSDFQSCETTMKKKKKTTRPQFFRITKPLSVASNALENNNDFNGQITTDSSHPPV